MMSQNKNIDFTIPHRQSPVAIILAIAKTTKTLLRQFVLPIIIFFIVGRKSNNYGDYFVYFVVFFSILTMVFTIINYYNTYFYIKGNELIVKSGVFTKKQVSVPFDRIQNINFEQNLVQQIFGVKKLKIDTAGSAEKEVELSAIEIHKAEALRALLISKQHATIVDQSHDTEPTSSKTILQLSFADLLKAGLFENHLKSGALIFVAVWYIYANAQEVGIDAEEYLDKMPAIAYSIYLFMFIAIIFLLVSIIISLVKTFLTYYKLNFSRINQGFKIERGLFNTVMVSALDHKIQTLSWSDSLIKKWVGIFDIKLKQAQASEHKENAQSITIPGASARQVQQVLDYLYPDHQYENIPLQKVHASYRNRRLALFSILPISVWLFSLFFAEWEGILLTSLTLIMLPIYLIRQYNKMAYGYNDEMIFLKGGIFGDKNTLCPIYKTQNIHKKISPFQAKRGLATVQLVNASGTLIIPYIEEAVADMLINKFLMKVETDQRHWM